MQRFEALLIPIIALIVVGALLLERVDPATVRIVAIVIVTLLLVYLIYGSYRRAKKKVEAARLEREALEAARRDQPAQEPPQP